MNEIAHFDPDAKLRQASALHRSGRLSEAAAAYSALLGRFPGRPEALKGLGAIALQLGRFEEGAAILGRLLELVPDQPETLSNRAFGLLKLKRYEEALASSTRAIALRPDLVEAYNNRGNALKALHRLEEALVSYDGALALAPACAEAHNNRGNTLRSLKRPEEALASYDRALALKSDFAEAHNGRGNSLASLNRQQEALSSYERALALRSGYAEAWNGRGAALMALDRPEEALASFDRALAVNPNHAEARNNRALVLIGDGHLDPALSELDRALAIKPDYAEAHWNKSIAKLLQGDFADGWRLYEWRWKTAQFSAARPCPGPLWLGNEDIAGKTLLIYREQGLGDFIQFCRYAPLAKALGVEVIMEVPAPLMPLLATMPGRFELIEEGMSLPAFDRCCPAMSLPLAFRTTLADVPAAVPYLHADEERRSRWREWLGEKTRPRIGLVWSGSREHRNDRNRSIPLTLLEPLLKLPFEFHSLQREIRPDDATMVQQGRILPHAERLSDFAETAALIREMDIVISVDTAVAHAAGAFGAKVWILLPFSPDFRWMLDSRRSPWYPSARLFRQSLRGDWSSVIREVADHLAAEWPAGPIARQTR
ncbi:MAG: tetratricopeptide repeat protein [Nevskia sp.]|nr:tetratricopeptide repeat protein [Nevskia sp.]